MAGMISKFDDREFARNTALLERRMLPAASRGLAVIANEAMRLSGFEVPHDTGELQNSGTVKKKGDLEYTVGYNKPYAARLHEHPEYRFQKGRKGKYLIDPIKNNLKTFGAYYTEVVKKELK